MKAFQIVTTLLLVNVKYFHGKISLVWFCNKNLFLVVDNDDISI